MSEITFGESTAETIKSTETISIYRSAVFVDGIKVGDLFRAGQDEFALTTWKPMPTEIGLQVPEMAGWLPESVKTTVRQMIERQLAKIDRGDPLEDADINPLHPDLQPWLVPSSFGMALKHSLIFSVPYYEKTAPDCNARYERLKIELKQAWEAKQWDNYVVLHERPYRLEAFLEVMGYLSDQDFWESVGDLWTDCENVFQNFEEWLTIWEAETPGRIDYVMDDDERAALAALPDIITVHRGYRHRVSKMGLSWTLKRDHAVWFANRYRKPGERAWVATGKARKEHVLAHFLSRGEAEIVMLPDNVFDVSTQAVKELNKRRPR